MEQNGPPEHFYQFGSCLDSKLFCCGMSAVNATLEQLYFDELVSRNAKI
jgi:hypothetical protein